MPTTHLPAHMDSVRQKCRPKHQLLVLKCYPRLPKNSAADVKPNSSELSYLLYYASTRRSKLQKVGAFLERKTAADVWRWQSARVLVTLQILTSLLEHKVIGHANGFALIAPSVLRIIGEIITNTNDVSLIEATVGTWEALCDRQESAALAADSEYRGLYEHVVRLYSNLAKNNPKKLAKSTQPVPHQNALRLRKAGLSALTCVFAPTELPSWRNSHFESAIPAISSNLRNDDPNYIDHINTLSAKAGDEEKVRTMNRRQSMATVRTVSGLYETDPEPDPRTAEGTAQDADRLEEEEVGILALECLKAVFESQNRAQIKGGAVAFMRYVSDEELRSPPRISEKPDKPSHFTSWVTHLFRLITSWTPVQERFILIVTAVETLVKEPLKGSNLHVQLLFTDLIDDVLRSDLNLIGLSVMDVLLSLTTHIQRAIHSGAPVVHSGGSTRNEPVTEKPMAQALLVQRLKDCIADLATHVYYSDQITDMISAIIYRIKQVAPVTQVAGQQNPTVASASTEDPKASSNETGSNSSRPFTRDKSDTTGFFASEAARQVGLEAVKDILDVAKSSRQYAAGSLLGNRNPVPVSVWKSTQYLQRDPSPKVRQAYMDALTTWAQLETEEKDASVIDFEADDCLAKITDTQEPAAASLRESLGQSYHSQRQQQLLMAPMFADGRRLSSGRTSSSAGGGERTKGRVKVEDLKQILEGKAQVQIHMGAKVAPPVDVARLLDGIGIGESGKPLAQPPYY